MDIYNNDYYLIWTGMFMREKHALTLAQAAMGAPLTALYTEEAGFATEAGAVYAALCKVCLILPR